MSTQDASTLLHAAESADASAEPPDLIKFTNALADALGISRQAVHSWRHRPGAPQRTDGYWSVREWHEYMRAHKLAAAQSVDRTSVITEVCTVILNKLPPRLSRHRLQQLLARIEIALHSSLPGTRFRSASYTTRTHRADV